MNKGRKMSITIKDIAKMADVSVSTVSRCLNNNPRISLATREKVHKIADELGFVANNSAKSLSTKKTGLVGLIYQESFDQEGSHTYVDNLCTHIRRELEKLHIDTIQIEAINKENNESNVIRLVKENKIDGFIFLHNQVTREDIRTLKRYHIPTVLVHFEPQFEYLNNYFVTDNFYGGYLAGQLLAQNGCTKPCIIRCDPDAKEKEFEERTNGFIKGFSPNGTAIKPQALFKVRSDVYQIYQIIIDNFDIIQKCDCIFSQSDVIAVGVIQALQKKGIDVPNDIQVVGYDDSYYSRILPPFITTIHQPKEEIAQKATLRIKDLITNTATDISIHEKIKPYLIRRDSTK